MVRSLGNELLTIEATGDYARAEALLDKYGKLTPEISSTIEKLTDTMNKDRRMNVPSESADRSYIFPSLANGREGHKPVSSLDISYSTQKWRGARSRAPAPETRQAAHPTAAAAPLDRY